MNEIKKATLGRLPIYLEFLREVQKERETVSTSFIAKGLSLGDVQVKKDLSSVCNKGKPKIGYKTAELIRDIEKIITNVKTGIILVGAGKIGKAILDYDGFSKFGLNIVAAFDNDEEKIGKSENGKVILPMSQLKEYCEKNGISIGIITVPKLFAQEVCDKLIDSGVKAIWNFAPVKLTTDKNVTILQENLALSLAYLNLMSI